MEEYNVKIYPTAQSDFKEIVDYLNTLSKQAAFRYYDLITEKIASLKEMPQRCPLAKDDQLRLKGYRTLIVENYTVFYCVKEKTVQVRRILYSRRQYDGLI